MRIVSLDSEVTFSSHFAVTCIDSSGIRQRYPQWAERNNGRNVSVPAFLEPGLLAIAPVFVPESGFEDGRLPAGPHDLHGDHNNQGK
jgi:hypothetical protein